MNSYTYTWKKYLPVIKLLLKRSSAGTQSIKLDSMDFNKGSSKTKTSQSFKVLLEKGRMQTISAPAAAKDLFEMLLEDNAAALLLRENSYEISLNSGFELKIDNNSIVPKNSEELQTTPEI